MSQSVLSLEKPESIPEFGLVQDFGGRYRTWIFRHDVYQEAVRCLGFSLECRYVVYRKVGLGLEGFVYFAQVKSMKSVRSQFGCSFTLEPCLEPGSWLTWITANGDFTERGVSPCYSNAEKAVKGGEATKRKWQALKEDVKVTRLDEITSLLVSLKRTMKVVEKEVADLMSEDETEDEAEYIKKHCVSQSCLRDV